MLKEVTPPSPLEELLEIMARLRHPVTGSGWEKAQTHESIAPNTLEEAYEVVDAIARADMGELKGELGDLLLQVVFQSQIAREEGHFTFNEVVQTLIDKIRRRLPAFFSGQVVSVEDQLGKWEKIKDAERARKGHSSLLDGITSALPALVRAQKLQDRAARAGFTWAGLAPALAKVDEELAEVRTAIASGNRALITEEIGDALLALVNVARMLEIDAEAALRGANAKFERRFRHVETAAQEKGRTLKQFTLAELVGLWREAKVSDRKDGGLPER